MKSKQAPTFLHEREEFKNLLLTLEGEMGILVSLYLFHKY